MTEKYESENSMMKYQIIFLKLQKFLYNMDKITRSKTLTLKAHFFQKLQKKTVISKLHPHKNYLGAKKGSRVLMKINKIIQISQLKRYLLHSI